MNIEQVEGQLAEFEGNQIFVVLPIRKTVSQRFYGKLSIYHKWEDHIISYEVKLDLNSSVRFQAHDVHSIVPTPTTDGRSIEVNLKSDTFMEQSNYNHT
jgi:hypothetical protein